jgi:hypothetical protein
MLPCRMVMAATPASATAAASGSPVMMATIWRPRRSAQDGQRGEVGLFRHARLDVAEVAPERPVELLVGEHVGHEPDDSDDEQVVAELARPMPRAISIEKLGNISNCTAVARHPAA